MKIGDPKKAVVLAVVALVILGVAVMQLIPKGGQLKAVRKPSPGPKETSTEPQISGPVAARELAKDPFIHPKLQEDKAKQPHSTEQKSAQARGATSDLKGDFNFGQLPEAGTEPIHPRTDGITGDGQQSQEKQPPKDLRKTVMLEAIVSVDHPKAFISIDGKPAAGYISGQTLPGIGKLTAITEATISIATPKKSATIKIGRGAKL